VRSALERALEVARQGEAAEPVVPAPRELTPYLGFRQLSGPAAVTVRRLLDEDEDFRGRVVAATTPEEVDAAGWLFLTRPDGWDEVLAAVAAAGEAAAGSEAAERRLRDLQRHLDTADRKLAHAEAELARHREEGDAAVEELAAVRRERRRAEDALAGAERRLEELEEKLVEREYRAQEAQGAREAREHELAETRRHLAEARAELDRRPPGPIPGEARVDVGALRDAMARLERSAATLARSVDAVAAQVPPAPVVLDDDGGPPTPGRRPTRLPGGLVDDSAAGARALLGQAGVLVLVDGYNVAKTAWPDEELEAQRGRLVRALDELAARTATEVEVVFDGPADPAPALRQGTPSVTVRYSGGELADDVVLDRIPQVPLERPVLVVSNDREVRDGARTRGANVIGSDTLISLFG
jgi:Mg2+ and Co2+ transporter CorA